MDSQTFFTIVLSFIFAGGVAIVPYAMSIPVIEPTLARWGVRIAWFAGIILCVWYGGTNDMLRSLRYTIAAGMGSALTVAACVALDYIKNREARTIAAVAPIAAVSQAQFAKVAELEKFLGGKDENGLRETFDLNNILHKNINAQIIRIGFIKSGREKDFLYNNYSDNGNFMFWAKDGHFTTGPSGLHINAGPQDVLFLVTTEKFQVAQKKLIEFLNSALIPESIKEEVSTFNKVINEDTELMTRILDDKMHQDENYFLHNMDVGTPYYGVIVTDFATRITQLKPAADRVLSAIATSWKTSQ